jgi:hypothetical protein
MRPNFVTKDVYDTGYSKVLNGNHLKLNILKDGQDPKMALVLEWEII